MEREAYQNEDEYIHTEFNIEEIHMSVSKLISGKSAGNDGINSDFYKNTRNEIIPILHTLFNAVFNSGCFPKSWA